MSTLFNCLYDRLTLTHQVPGLCIVLLITFTLGAVTPHSKLQKFSIKIVTNSITNFVNITLGTSDQRLDIVPGFFGVFEFFVFRSLGVFQVLLDFQNERKELRYHLVSLCKFS